MKPVPRSAFTDVSGFEAKKHAIRQTTDGLWQLTRPSLSLGMWTGKACPRGCHGPSASRLWTMTTLR